MDWAEYLDQILAWITVQNKIFIWIFFFLSNLMENVFPPWPGDTVTVFGGFFVAHGEEYPSQFGMIGLISSTLLGNLAGGYIMYRFGHRFLQWVRNKNFPFKEELYSEEKIESTFDWFRRNSILVVLISRFSAGIRFFVSIVAGMVHMNPILFFSLFTVGVSVWCGLLIGGGYSLGRNWEQVLNILAMYNKFIFGLIILGILIWTFNHFTKKQT
ncbi:DedA family protein [Leptospira sp. GIMC2001]|uniref:DedA family protein n=1 Tax=Leptospira sp. GIMC2001 TaxID=1513297 RepID=UPI00234A3625|nr:DedA family protein [Leptospira sp. GIMC2001]WCL50955.1 DedA family protein [Leptospira sp. GIMC2001]